MISSRVWRPLALAGVFGATLGAASAAAQTVVVRGLAPGTAAEVVQGGATAAGTANDAGDAVMKGTLSEPGEVRVNLYVDVCATVRRLVIVDRDATPPPPQEGCTRTPLPGLFVIQPISTIVVNLAGATPTVLLRQGPFDLRAPRAWARSPTGLIIFGGGGFSQLHNARALACAGIAECPGDDRGAAFAGGVAYWLTPYLGVEASYMKPRNVASEGAVGNSLFRTTLEPHVVMFQGKVGAPLGPVRIFGQGGATYHRADHTTVQNSVDGIEDRFELRTAGWGWTFGGGIEAWVAPAVALYGEAGRAALKGKGVETGGEGSLDERMTFVIVGLRVSFNR
ncbi:MAG: outer membrane beta-barrel protein [Vicinamibacterales bacterium]